MIARCFETYDANHDGVLDKAEAALVRHTDPEAFANLASSPDGTVGKVLPAPNPNPDPGSST